MMYPIPYPSAATGPKPNSRSAGLPQFYVERIEVLRSDQPGSVKMAGSGDLPQQLESEMSLADDAGRSSKAASRSRWRTQ